MSEVKTNKWVKKINSRFAENGNHTAISFEVLNPLNAYEMIIYVKPIKFRRPVCSIAFFPEGHKNDGIDQKIIERSFSKEEDIIQFTSNTIVGDNKEEIDLVRRSLMRGFRIFKDIEENADFYLKIMRESIDND